MQNVRTLAERLNTNTS